MESVGSEFSWEGLPNGPFLAWPKPNSFYRLGRHALVAACRQLMQAGSRIRVPSYLCPQVTKALANSEIDCVTYDDIPTHRAPVWKSLDVRPGDAVLAVNYFGIRDGSDWSTWREQHPFNTLIEDHTHDPCSKWASTSTADFAFASLRKVLPVPDGGILWSPRGRSLPTVPTDDDWRGSALKLAGMIWKGSGATSEIYRSFERDGEQLLECSDGAGITPWSHALLEQGFPVDLRNAREQNVRRFFDLFSDSLANNHWVEPLFTSWPEGACPLNPVLVFHDEWDREVVRKYLISQRIYTPVHWPLNESQDVRMVSMARRILTVPLDHRCRPERILQIVESLKKCLSRRMRRWHAA